MCTIDGSIFGVFSFFIRSVKGILYVTMSGKWLSGQAVEHTICLIRSKIGRDTPIYLFLSLTPHFLTLAL